MKKLAAAMAMTALMTVAGATDGVAQTATGNASVTIPTVLVISSVGDLTIASGFDFSTANESAATGTVSIVTRSNIAHAVDVTSTTVSLGTDNLVFEVQNSDLAYMDATGTVKALANLPRGEQTNDVSFRATANVATHAPGEYTGTITYTVLATY